MSFFVIDFEASGLDLGKSYPIEVGYTNGIIEYSTLIKPASNWTYWNKESEGIHKISRNELQAGKTPEEVCERMNKDLFEECVYCDGGMYDLYWLSVLYESCNKTPTFNLKFVQTDDFKNIKHRALDDARQIHNYLRKLDD